MINKFEKYFLYKILSIIGFLEIILVPLNLINVWYLTNPTLRLEGTEFIAVCLVLILFPLNFLLLLGLLLEKRFRNNVCEIVRKKLTKIGFQIFLFNTIFGSLMFLFAIYLIIR
jgi:hypothetical protein